jgi:ubiquinone biosynthesis UbiH/UbiF/VisC/COQ6 family hydroxylase
MEFDLIIVGSGLAGASLAVALRGSRLKIGLIEHAQPQFPSGWDSRVYAISPSNAAWLAQMGVWEHLDPARMAPVYHMAVKGDQGGTLDFSAYECGVEVLAWILESSLMQRELWETVKRQANVTLLCPAKPQSVQFGQDSAELSLADGRVLTSRLLVAADGAQSWLRQQTGIEARFTPYHEKGVVANFVVSKPHRDIAFQWFREDGILAYLPLPGNLISIVWSAPDAVADELLSLSAEAFCQRVAEASGYALGELKLETAPAGFSLRLMRPSAVVAQRVALIGDAAHAIHPLSGHGINLGFQDAKVLAQLLQDLPAWGDPGERRLLRAYARARAEEPVLLQYTTHALNHLFRPRHPLIAGLRNWGLNLTNRLPVVRNALVRYAVSGHF